MAKWAIIDQKGNVVNCVLWDGPTKEWLPPRNHYVVQYDQACVGDLYNFEKQTFTRFDKRPDYIAPQELAE